MYKIVCSQNWVKTSSIPEIYCQVTTNTNIQKNKTQRSCTQRKHELSKHHILDSECPPKTHRVRPSLLFSTTRNTGIFSSGVLDLWRCALEGAVQRWPPSLSLYSHPEGAPCPIISPLSICPALSQVQKQQSQSPMK